MRVEGGQANVNLEAFKKALGESIVVTWLNPLRRRAFERRAVELGYPRDTIAADFAARYRAIRAGAADRAKIAAHATMAGPGRNDALAAIAYVLFNYDIGVPSNTNEATAPVNFPYLWDITHLYWVQYNGAVHQPMSRNIGEAIGVGAVTHFVDPATGAPAPAPGRWRTTISVRNLYALETIVASLKPPVWPQAVFGPIDRAQADRGRQLFTENCGACHSIRAIANSKNDTWSVKVLSLEKIGTDPMQANNFAHTYYDGTKFGLSNHVNAAEGLQAVTAAIRTQAYHDEHIPQSEWPEYDGYGRPDLVTTPCGYKARPLVGVWATPPYLHNGSVPTIFDLLSETRPARFHTGGTEYDPQRLGFIETTGPDVVLIDTSIVGNSNAGHWFTNDTARPGRIGRRLSGTEKYAIIEYLKIASYADYPRVKVSSPDPEPCVAETSYSSQSP
jgi:mono/diheme cytochrome c family protein